MENTELQETWRAGKVWLGSRKGLPLKSRPESNYGLHTLLILVPEKTRQAGCEFKARLGYMRALRSDSVFKRKVERKKIRLHDTVAHVVTSERNPCSQIIVGLGDVICVNNPRNKKRDLL